MPVVKFAVFEGKSFVSKAIRFVTRSSKYSHVGFLTNTDELIECWPTPGNKFQNWTLSSFANHKKGTSYEIWELKVSKPKSFLIHCFFQDQLNFSTKYDWLGVLAFVFKSLNTSPRRLFCSEGCIKPLVKLFDWTKITPSHVSPQNFVEILQVAGARCTRTEVT